MESVLNGGNSFQHTNQDTEIISMPTLQTPFLSDISSDAPIPHGRLAYLRERARNRLFEFILKKFLEAEKHGLTKAKLARRIHHRPEVITRLLGSPQNWTTDTATDLLVGIAGEELEPASVSLVNPALGSKHTCRCFAASAGGGDE